jgi:hypothetical protein
MFPRVTEVKYIKDYIVGLTFSNGVQSELDLKDKVSGRGGVLAELGNIEFFRQVTVDPEAGTLVWPNGVDFCPDVLYSQATGTPIQAPETA